MKQRRDNFDDEGDDHGTPVGGFAVVDSDKAIAGIVDTLLAVRASIHNLHAVEANLLGMADGIASELARQEKHPDHGDFAHRSVAAEIGTALHETDRTMIAKIARAVTLTTEYPTVAAALSAGKISLPHATVITDAGVIITNDEARTQYSEAALEVAVIETVGRTRPIVKELAERFADRTIDERHTEAVAGRSVSVTETCDGMAHLHAFIPAVLAYGIKDRLTQMARRVKLSETDQAAERQAAVDAGEATAILPRTLDQIRADLFTDMLLTSDPNKVALNHNTGIASIKAHVQVIMPSAKVDPEHVDDPDSREGCATMSGFGPIDTDTAQHLAGFAPNWERITTNGGTGNVLSVETYRPTEAIKRFLRARDQHCRFPGCRTPLARCDIDHTVDAALGGSTSTDNLAHLCRWHHTLKHHSAWTVTQSSDGTLDWVSPTGREHREKPPSRVRFEEAWQPF